MVALRAWPKAKERTWREVWREMQRRPQRVTLGSREWLERWMDESGGVSGTEREEACGSEA